MANTTNTSTIGTPSTTSDSLLTDKVVMVVVLLLALTWVMTTNLLVIRKVGKSALGCRGKSSRWSAPEKLIRTLCMLGMLMGGVSIPPYLLTICSGRWVLGEALCRCQGYLSSIIINAWYWMLAIAAFERYLKLLKPSEHRCFFSEVNTKIMTWGAILLLSVMNMGPVYGWGEYTIFRGKLDLIISISSNSSALSPEGLSFATTYLASLLLGQNPVAMETMKNLTSFFTEERQINIRKPHFDPLTGMVLPLRVSTRAALQSLWSDYEAGSLVTSLQEMVASNASLQEEGIPAFDLSISISEEKYQIYHDVHMSFQEGATCSLDYSDVNEHMQSFIIFSWSSNMAVPLILMCYCYGRLCCGQAKKIREVSSVQSKKEDSMWTFVCAFTGFSSLVCGVPFGVASVLAGRGIYVPTSVHFATTVLVYFSPSLLPLSYLCALYNQPEDYFDVDVGGQTYCCFRRYKRRLYSFRNYRQSLSLLPDTSSPRQSMVSLVSSRKRVSFSSRIETSTTLAFIEETLI